MTQCEEETIIQLASSYHEEEGTEDVRAHVRCSKDDYHYYGESAAEFEHSTSITFMEVKLEFVWHDRSSMDALRAWEAENNPFGAHDPEQEGRWGAN